ncbi:hypothetical protein ABPG72_007449 [Tetrahymena utriculariae]
MMHMIMEFTRDVQFVFKTWYAQETENSGWFYLGLVLTFIYCFAHMFLPRLEKFLRQFLLCRSSSMIVIRLVLTSYQFIYQLSNIIVMMLMMTMNFWVGLVIALGCGIGYSFNGIHKEWRDAVKKYEPAIEVSNISSTDTPYNKF